MWLQQAESRSQGEEVLGKTERAEEDTLPEQARTTWLMIALKSVANKVTLDPGAWPEEATEEGIAIDEAVGDEPLSI
jgi:hypothetical protein